MKPFAETRLLLAANFRRDIKKIIIWLVGLAGLFVAVAYKFEGLYGSRQQIETIVTTLKSKAMVSLFGPLPHVDHLTTAIIFAGEMLIFWSIFMVIFNITLAIGATRVPEEEGLTEMLRGGHPVGRQAPLLAAILEISIVDLVFFVITGVGTQLANLPGANSMGTWLLAAALSIVGWAFGMFTLVLAQSFNDSKNATMVSYLLFGITYLMRMISDVSDQQLTWLSPLGWVEKTSIYVNNNWLPIGLYLVFGGFALMIALALNANRDIDAGLVAVKPGQATNRFLRGPLSLLVWNQKTTSLGWIIGVALLGASYGSIFDSIGKLVNDSPVIRQVLGTGGVMHAQKLQLLSFVGILSMVFALLGILAGGMVINRLYADETRGYLELVSVKPVHRTTMILIPVSYGIVLAELVLIAAMFGMQAAGNAVLKHPLAAKYFWQSILAMTPTVLLFLGILTLFVGAIPKLRSLTWLYLGVAFVISYFGKLLKLPDWGLKVSPFYWFQKVPVKTTDWTAWWVILVIALVCLLGGVIGYNKRDLRN